MAIHFINADLVKVYRTTEKKKNNIRTVLAWGDEVEVSQLNANQADIIFRDFKENPDGSILPIDTHGFILKGSSGPSLSKVLRPIGEKNVLKISFVDVQQGDGCVIETPKGKVILLDGGENQMFARYLAARYSGSSPDNPKIIECIVVSHGDADHFAGLPEILKSETQEYPKKRLFINPLRVYHNGIVKRPGKTPAGTKRKDTELLGGTAKKGNQLYLTELEENLLDVANEKLNAPFKKWKSALKEYNDFYSNSILFKRLDHQSSTDFHFLADENINVQVLGPISEKLNNKPALKFLRQPPKSVAAEVEENLPPSGAYSASHTINGHSIILRMTYGNINFLFAGDLNEEAEDLIVAEANSTPIRSEVLKVPHHGSADFSNKFFEAVQPLVSVVSSGDESEMKEYIHPRATLVGALGKYSRINRPLIFITELVAFFKKEGWAKSTEKNSSEFFAFSRTAYGVVHVRTDGKRILVFTHSGQKDLKEAYSYEISSNGTPTRKDIVMV